MDNQQPRVLVEDQGSTTIPRKGSKLDNFLIEKPDNKLNKLFDRCKIKTSCIYMIYTITNDTIYIGSTTNLQKRFQKHRNALVKNNHYNQWMQRVFNKHGSKNFYYLVVEDTNDLEIREKYWIEYFNSFKEGYNATEDTSRNFLNQELIEQNIKRTSKPIIVLDLAGKFIEELSSVSDASRKYNTSSSNISRCCKKEFRFIKDKIFIYKDEYDSKNNYFLTKRDYSKSDSWREKISQSHKGKKHTKEHRDRLAKIQGKSVVCLDDNITFVSLRECARHYNVNSSSIRKAIENKRRCKGLLFKIVEEIV